MYPVTIFRNSSPPDIYAEGVFIGPAFISFIFTGFTSHADLRLTINLRRLIKR